MRLKLFSGFCSIALVLLFFQSCGGLTDSNLFSQSPSGSSNNNSCTSEDCFANSDLLWISIREFEPYVIEITNIDSHFTVGGQCGVGGFPQHRFHWELTENFGNEEVIGRGSVNNLCISGLFQVPIIANQKTFQADQRYEVRLEIVGIDKNGSEVTGYSPYRTGSVGVLIEAEEENQD